MGLFLRHIGFELLDALAELLANLACLDSGPLFILDCLVELGGLQGEVFDPLVLLPAAVVMRKLLQLELLHRLSRLFQAGVFLSDRAFVFLSLLTRGGFEVSDRLFFLFHQSVELAYLLLEFLCLLVPCFVGIFAAEDR